MLIDKRPTNFIDPYLFKLLNRIKKEITSPYPACEMTEGKIIELVVDQIKDVGDRLNLPIFRIENKFVIYENDQPRVFPNRSLEKFLLLVCEHLGVEKELMESIPFKNQMFGRCWRTFAPEV